MASFVAPNLPQLLLEVAEYVADKERDLPTPQSRIVIAADYATSRIQITGSLPLASVTGAGGVIGLTAANYIGDVDPVVVTGTPIATIAPTNPVSALMAVVERLEQAEKAKAATAAGLPASSGTTWQTDDTDTFVFDSQIVCTVSFDAASGQLRFVPIDYTI